MPRTNWEILKQYPIAIPDKHTMALFNKIVEPAIDKIIHNIKQIRTLESLRDTLLPKLMSGKVRVQQTKSAA
jgi:type I restriction enzyme S subunit